MDSFFTSWDKTSAAQEEFGAHFQTRTLNPKDKHNTNKGTDALVRWVSRCCWVAVVVAGGRSATGDNATAAWSLIRGKQFILYLLLINR